MPLFLSHSNATKDPPVAIGVRAHLRVFSAARATSHDAQTENHKRATDAMSLPHTAATSRWLSPGALPSLAISNSSRHEHLRSGPTCSALSDSNLPKSSAAKHKKQSTSQRRASG